METEIIISDDEDVPSEETSSNTLVNQSAENGNLSSEKSYKKGFCVNATCKNHNAKCLKYCPLEALHYFKIKHDSNKSRYICDQCLRIVSEELEKSVNNLSNDKPLYSRKKEEREELFAISDSEDDNPQDGIDIDLGDDEIEAEFLDNNLIDMLNEIFEKYDIQEKIIEKKAALDEEEAALKKTIENMEVEMTEIQSKIDAKRAILYSYFKVTRKSIGEIQIPILEGTLQNNAIVPYEALKYMSNMLGKSRFPMDQRQIIPQASGPVTLPPIGQLPRLKPEVGAFCFALRHTPFAAWFRARIIEVTSMGNPPDTFTTLKIRFESHTSQTVKMVTGRQIACHDPCPVRMPVGTRVIAIFRDMQLRRDSFYVGIIAEPPKTYNNFRYLVFFDDGYTQYVEHHRIRLVMECSRNVWSDIHEQSMPFIKQYLEDYPDRPMVKFQVGQTMKAEYAGKWWKAKVLNLDASLVNVLFEVPGRTEWIYRGSSRLATLYLEIKAAMNRQDGRHRPAQIQSRKHCPYVEYTRGDDPDEILPQFSREGPASRFAHARVTNRNVVLKSTGPTVSNNKAKKSTTSVRRPEMWPQSSKAAAHGDGSQGKVVYYSPKTPIPSRKYVQHECGSTCMPVMNFDLKAYNPLSKPLLSGWERLMLKGKYKKIVVYKSPCGRRLRNMRELHTFLVLTHSKLSVDCFDFNPCVHCLAEFVLDRYIIMKDDISDGKENMPIPCVNYHDSSLPEYSTYSTVRIPTEGVNLNLDQEFLCGCDCEDDCQDKSKCACWKLTLEGARSVQPRLKPDNVGYEFKRLNEPVTTGIYECNSRCKCAATCLNRVAQHPLSLKLQLFKTTNRGWGIRCLNDIPQGTFICIYAGNLLTEQKANDGGTAYGDEYFAELDYIEVVENLKEGYEADVVEERTPTNDDGDEDEDEIEDSGSMTRDSDEEFVPSVASSTSGSERAMRTRLSRKRSSTENKTESAKESESDVEKTEKTEKTEATTEAVKVKPDPDKTGNNSSSSSDWTAYECITISDDDEPLKEPSSFAPAKELIEVQKKQRYRSVRELYGDKEYCYIMDAKTIGNLGRYLNHSCNPNVFVQNVFVDTHDLRFPWVAFFALTFIRAGTELTWNYNYDVNSVPGKVMYCQCGSPECRGRLL